MQPRLPTPLLLRLSCLALLATACERASTTETTTPEPAANTPVELEASATAKIAIELVNACAVTKRFVLGSPEYPEVEPPADAKVHELAAGAHQEVQVEPGQWFLHLRDDGSVGGGGSSREDGARITFRGSGDACEAIEVQDHPD